MGTNGVWAFIGRGLGLVASAIGIATIGWFAAVSYHGLSGMVAATYTSSRLQEQCLQIESLRADLRQRDEMLKAMNLELSNLRNIPTDRDWEVLCTNTLGIFAALVTSARELAKADALMDGIPTKGVALMKTTISVDSPGFETAMKDPLSAAKWSAEQIAKTFDPIVADFRQIGLTSQSSFKRLKDQEQFFVAALTGAGMVRPIDTPNGQIFTLAKFPARGVDLLTGNVVILTESSSTQAVK